MARFQSPRRSDVPYLGRTIEVNVPNNIQEGHKIRLKGMGYIDTHSDKQGDLFIIVSKIKYRKDNEKEIIQKMLIVQNNNFEEVNGYLENGWYIKDYKPFRQESNLYVYVLIEKVKDIWKNKRELRQIAKVKTFNRVCSTIIYY